MNQRTPLVAAVAFLAFTAVAAALPPDNEPAAAGRAVPLPYVLRTDSGTALHVNPDGSVTDGQNELFDAGAQLFVGDNFQYAPENQQASFDAKRNELQFPSLPANGLNVSRRVAADARGGWWRFTETLENPGQVAVRTTAHVHYDLSGAVLGVENVADERARGAVVGATVFDGNHGIAILAAGRGPGAKLVRPSVNAQPTGDSLDLVYDIEVPPRKTVSIVHALAIKASQNEAAAFLKSLKDADVLRGIAPELLKTLLNFRTGGGAVGDMEILRGELFDVVELRGGDVYKGTLREKTFQLQTPYGPVELPAERVVAMVTLGQYRPTQLLVTGDGEVFGGTLRGDSVKLELSSGQVTAVPLANVRRFGYRRRPGEPEELTAPAGKPLVILRAGDRIAVDAPAAPLVVASCYGNLKLDPRTVASITFQSDDHEVHEVRLVDGSHFAGVVTQDKFELTLAGAGSSRAVSLAAASVKRLQLAPEVEEPPSDAAQLELSNGDLLVGGLVGTVVLETAFDAIKVEAEGLQGLRAGGEGAAEAGVSPNEVQLTLWDGTTLSGRVRGDAVDCALRCGASLRVPVAMVKRYAQPRPRPSPQVVERIKAVVADLNADDWKARDRAAAQLASIGSSAAAVLKELRDGQPPEVRQRIDQILAGFDGKPQNVRPAPQPAPPAEVEAAPERG
jgi:hypothetical protein